MCYNFYFLSLQIFSPLWFINELFLKKVGCLSVSLLISWYCSLPGHLVPIFFSKMWLLCFAYCNAHCFGDCALLTCFGSAPRGFFSCINPTSWHLLIIYSGLRLLVFLSFTPKRLWILLFMLLVALGVIPERKGHLNTRSLLVMLILKA